MPDCSGHWKTPTLVSPLRRISFWKLIHPQSLPEQEGKLLAGSGVKGGAGWPALPSSRDQRFRQAQGICCSAESSCYVVETWSIHKVKRKRLGASFSSSLLNRAAHSRGGIPHLPGNLSLCGCRAFVLIWNGHHWLSRGSKLLTELISLRRSKEAPFVLGIVGKLRTAGTAAGHGAGVRARTGPLETHVGWQQILLGSEGETPCPHAELFNTEGDVVVGLVQ